MSFKVTFLHNSKYAMLQSAMGMAGGGVGAKRITQAIHFKG